MTNGQKTQSQFHILKDGFVALNHGIARSPRLTVYEKAAYTILVGHLNKDNGLAWPGVKLLAQEMPCSERQAKTALAGLKEKLGLQMCARGRGQTALYWFDEDVVNAFLGREIESRSSGAKSALLAGQNMPSPLEEEPWKKNHTRTPLISPLKGGKAKRGKHEITDAETSEVLALFQDRNLDIPIEIAAWRAWCAEHHKVPTKRRLIVWLSRAKPDLSRPQPTPVGVWAD